MKVIRTAAAPDRTIGERIRPACAALVRLLPEANSHGGPAGMR
jgi:hypothetical protein